MQRGEFDAMSIAALLRQTEANISALKNSQEESDRKPLYAPPLNGGIRSTAAPVPAPAPGPWPAAAVVDCGKTAAQRLGFGTAGSGSSQGHIELEAQVLQLRASVDSLERRLEDDLRAFLGVCDKRLQAREEQLRSVSETMQASADSISESMCRKVDARMRDVERASTERTDRSLEDIWENIRRLQTDGRQVDTRLQRCATSDELGDRFRELERNLSQRLEEKLVGQERKAVELRAQLESASEAWREAISQRCHQLEARVWEQQQDRGDFAETLLKRLPESSAFRELQDDLRNQTYANEVQQRRLTACEAKCSKIQNLESKVTFTESQTVQQLEEHAAASRGFTETAQALAQKLAASEGMLQRVEAQGAMLESRLQQKSQEDSERMATDLEALRQRVNQRVDDVEGRLLRGSAQVERELTQQFSTLASKTSEGHAETKQILDRRHSEMHARIDSFTQDLERKLRETCEQSEASARGGAEETARRHAELQRALEDVDKTHKVNGNRTGTHVDNIRKTLSASEDQARARHTEIATEVEALRDHADTIHSNVAEVRAETKRALSGVDAVRGCVAGLEGAKAQIASIDVRLAAIETRSDTTQARIADAAGKEQRLQTTVDGLRAGLSAQEAKTEEGLNALESIVHALQESVADLRESRQGVTSSTGVGATASPGAGVSANSPTSPRAHHAAVREMVAAGEARAMERADIQLRETRQDIGSIRNDLAAARREAQAAETRTTEQVSRMEERLSQCLAREGELQAKCGELSSRVASLRENFTEIQGSIRNEATSSPNTAVGRMHPSSPGTSRQRIASEERILARIGQVEDLTSVLEEQVKRFLQEGVRERSVTSPSALLRSSGASGGGDGMSVSALEVASRVDDIGTRVDDLERSLAEGLDQVENRVLVVEKWYKGAIGVDPTAHAAPTAATQLASDDRSGFSLLGRGGRHQVSGGGHEGWHASASFADSSFERPPPGATSPSLRGPGLLQMASHDADSSDDITFDQSFDAPSAAHAGRSKLGGGGRNDVRSAAATTTLAPASATSSAASSAKMPLSTREPVAHDGKAYEAKAQAAPSLAVRATAAAASTASASHAQSNVEVASAPMASSSAPASPLATGAASSAMIKPAAAPTPSAEMTGTPTATEVTDAASPTNEPPAAASMSAVSSAAAPSATAETTVTPTISTPAVASAEPATSVAAANTTEAAPASPDSATMKAVATETPAASGPDTISEKPTIAAAVSSPETAEEGLLVRILAAFNLRNRDSGLLGDVSDPFVIVKVGAQTYQTETVTDNLNPVWTSNNAFHFELSSNADREILNLEVMDHNRFHGNKSLGVLQVVLSCLKVGQLERRRARLEEGRGGELEYEVLYVPSETHVGESLPPSPQKSPPASPEQPVARVTGGMAASDDDEDLESSEDGFPTRGPAKQTSTLPGSKAAAANTGDGKATTSADIRALLGEDSSDESNVAVPAPKGQQAASVLAPALGQTPLGVDQSEGSDDAEDALENLLAAGPAIPRAAASGRSGVTSSSGLGGQLGAALSGKSPSSAGGKPTTAAAAASSGAAARQKAPSDVDSWDASSVGSPSPTARAALGLDSPSGSSKSGERGKSRSKDASRSPERFPAAAASSPASTVPAASAPLAAASAAPAAAPAVVAEGSDSEFEDDLDDSLPLA